MTLNSDDLIGRQKRQMVNLVILVSVEVLMRVENLLRRVLLSDGH